MNHPLSMLTLLTALSAAFQANAESVPPLINYQGFLADANATPLAGTRKLAFNLYDFPNAVTPIWGPQVFESIPLVNGRFDVILGTTDTNGRSLAEAVAGKERYLGITVDGKEILPRQPILPAVSAASAQPAPSAENAAGGLQGVPPGSIIAYWSDRIPDGWLLCDGSAIPEGAKYDTLRGLINGNLPDLRGLFLRGIGQNSNPAFRYDGDASRVLSQLQQDEFKSHTHIFDDYTFSENSGNGGTAWGSSGRSDIDNSPGSPFSHATASAGGDETRPKNAAVYWMIKY